MSDDDIKEVAAESASEQTTNDAPELAAVEPEDDAPEVEASDSQSTGQKEIAPQEGIQELKKRLAAEQLARQQAERMAHEHQLEAQRHKTEAHDANYQTVLSAISLVEQRSLALRTAYAEAMQVGDYDKAAQVQEAIAVNAGNLSDLQRGKKAIEEAAERAKRQPVQPMPRTVDPVEQIASQVSPRSANWLRSIREHIPDERAIKRMFRAHEDAVDEGIEPDSDDYFAFLEKRIGVRRDVPAPRHVERDDDGSPLSAASAPAPRRSSPPPAAPVSRGGPRGNAVRLSSEEREIARMCGQTEEQYAQSKETLRRAGKIG